MAKSVELSIEKTHSLNFLLHFIHSLRLSEICVLITAILSLLKK